MKGFYRFSFISFFFIALNAYSQDQIPATTPRVKAVSFPFSVQFTPVPSGKGWRDEKPPLTDQVIEETIHNIILHGASNLSFGEFGTGGANEKVVNYAQKLGMKIDVTSNGVQLFKRNQPPKYNVYSPHYIDSVKKRIVPVLGNVKEVKSAYTIWPFMDEPFHADTTSFDYSRDVANAFRKIYNYDMPSSYAAAKKDPKKHLDFVNFQSSTFPVAWRQIYKEVKAYAPGQKIVLTHDSHNTMGGGVNSDSRYAVDDVFHWGGDFADIFVYDIYPYTMFDYRYGEYGKLPKPRLSQMHYTMAQMRNLTTTYNKELGFWLGTYNEGWFRRYMNSEMERQYWGEREMAYTAIANGCNYLITGINIPQEARHWDDLGKGMRAVQKIGSEILASPKVKSRACFLFPRSQYVQLNEEYYNAGLTFELCLRSFGELDIIHEEQITSDKMNGYDILIMADVKMLPAEVAKNIEAFVKKGGIVVSDCVPQMDSYYKPLQSMNDLFGVKSASTERVNQLGVWNPFSMLPPQWAFNIKPASDSEKKVDKASGSCFGKQYDFNVITPRNCVISDGKAMLSLASGQPAFIQKETGKGKTYLLGFCLQDTYFQTWKKEDPSTRSQLYDLMHSVFADSKVKSHAYSSNPDMEVTVRSNGKEAIVFVINHESPNAITDITLADLGFEPGEIQDVEWGREDRPVVFKKEGNTITFTVMAVEGTPTGVTRLLKITPKNNKQ
jgi:hypothetical protein